MKSKARFNGSNEELSKIFDLYKLKVLGVHPLDDGIINTSYRLDVGNGSKLVLRIYQNGNKTNDSIDKELDFMDRMRDAGIPIPKVLNNNLSEKLTIFKDLSQQEWQAIVMEFAEGRHLKPDDFDIISEFAAYQAKMHLASAKLDKKSDKPDFKAMVDWMDKEFNEAKTKSISKEVSGKVKAIYNELKQNIELNYKEILALPYGNVHLDYDSDNVILNNGKIKAILDFDDMSCQPFILDTANSLWWWLFKNESKNHKTILSAYFKSYNKIREIADEEYEFFSLFLRMRNLTLMCLLYINIPEEVRYEKVNQGIVLDPLLKQVDKQ